MLRRASLADLTDDVWDDMLSVDLTGVMRTMRSCAPFLTSGGAMRFDYNDWAKHPGTFSLYVTKNGSAWDDTVAPDGSVRDPGCVDRCRGGCGGISGWW